MTEICRHRIEHPVAWTSAAIGGKDGLPQRTSKDGAVAGNEGTRHGLALSL
jgi:hypothetical protein